MLKQPGTRPQTSIVHRSIPTQAPNMPGQSVRSPQTPLQYASLANRGVTGTQVYNKPAKTPRRAGPTVTVNPQNKFATPQGLTPAQPAPKPVVQQRT
jgi:hypothetical protein